MANQNHVEKKSKEDFFNERCIPSQNYQDLSLLQENLIRYFLLGLSKNYIAKNIYGVSNHTVARECKSVAFINALNEVTMDYSDVTRDMILRRLMKIVMTDNNTNAVINSAKLVLQILPTLTLDSLAEIIVDSDNSELQAQELLEKLGLNDESELYEE